VVAGARDSKQLFSDELRAARGILADRPMREIYGHLDGLPVRRILLEKTRCHLYYVVLEHERLIRIVAVWGATKGRDPSSIEAFSKR
jgi:hypothetical protein